MDNNLQNTIDDIARCARRHANDRDGATYSELLALYQKLLSRKRHTDITKAATGRKSAVA